MTIFEQVKEPVDMPTVARFYGLDIRRGNMAICPFHAERTPSCKLYERNYHCFGCGEHGDVITLVQKLFGLSAIEAVRQINSDFCLGLEVDKPPERADIERLQRAKSEREKYQQWENNAYKILHDYLWLLRDILDSYKTENEHKDLNSRFVYSLKNIEYAEYMANEFLIADKEEKLFMKDEVERIEREIYRLKNSI